MSYVDAVREDTARQWLMWRKRMQETETGVGKFAEAAHGERSRKKKKKTIVEPS